MSPAKKKKRSSPLPPALQKLLAFVRGPGRSLVLTVLIVAALVGGWLAIWYGTSVRQYVLSSGEFIVTPQKVEITPLPPWIHSDVRGEVFRGVGLDEPLSIMDDDLAEQISNAFSLHPWVSKVHRVLKHHPARVEVELAYRRPVCMVAVPGGLFPVDTEGVLLPVGDFSPVEAARYPRLAGVDSLPVGTAGDRWGDPAVVGGAQIAAALGEAWGELGLAEILPSGDPATGTAEERMYILATDRGTRIFWGRAPGGNAIGELPAADKVALLKKYAQEHGDLEGHNGPQNLDVRRLHSLRMSSR